VLSGLHRAIGLTAGEAKVLLVVLTLGSTGLLVYLRYGSQRTARTIAAVTAGVVLVWNAYGEISFSRESHNAASAELSPLPRPLDWVDRAVPHGVHVTYLGQSIDDPYDVLQLEFWNRKVQQVWSTDGTAPGPGAVTPDVTSTDGTLAPFGTGYVVADSGVVPVGRVLGQESHHGGRGARTWTLYYAGTSLRLRRTIDGIYADGWGKPTTALNQFSLIGSGPKVIKVHVFRTFAARRYPATVRVTLGTMGLRAGPSGLHAPAIGTMISTKKLHVRDNLDHTFIFRAPRAPFRVETSVTPFPHERDPRIGDPRDLGANVEYSVTPVS